MRSSHFPGLVANTSNQSESVKWHPWPTRICFVLSPMCIPTTWLCCSFQFPLMAGVALDVIGFRLVATFCTTQKRVIKIMKRVWTFLKHLAFHVPTKTYLLNHTTLGNRLKKVRELSNNLFSNGISYYKIEPNRICTHIVSQLLVYKFHNVFINSCVICPW